jgi:tripartite-type tricarboxylate transporter receptor subunit TctC
VLPGYLLVLIDSALEKGRIKMFRSKKYLPKAFLVVFFSMLAVLTKEGLSQESYPNRPITLVVPFGAGGTSDAAGRFIAKCAEKELGQPIVVENKSGGGGSIGVSYVLKSKPDGYTLGLAQTSGLVIHPHMKKLPYNPLTDLTDITVIVNMLLGLGVRLDSPWKTFDDVIAYARNNPGRFTYSCAGIGTAQHICMEQIAIKEGIKWTAVPFKSGAEATVAFLGGHTDGVVQTTMDMLPHEKRFRFVLSVGDKRWPDFPNVPNTLDKGYNFYAMSYTSIIAPRGVPEPIMKKLEGVFEKAKKNPSFIEEMDKLKVETSTLSGKEYSDLWRSKYDEMGKVIKILGL